MASDNGNLRFRPVRMVILLLAAALFCLIGLNWQETSRRVRFFFTGAVAMDGYSLYLHPKDDHLTKQVLKTGSYELEETKLVRSLLKEGDTFIDVGANIGWYTVLASRLVGPHGKVISFEPDPTNFALLKRNVEANGLQNVILEQKALSKEPGTLKLYQHATNPGRHSVVLSFNHEAFVEVETLRLDDYLKKHEGGVDLIKIDTEGAEGLILEGMQDTLRKQPQMDVLIEFSPLRLKGSGYEPSKVFALFQTHGFKITTIDGKVGEVNSVAQLHQEIDRRNMQYIDLHLQR